MSKKARRLLLTALVRLGNVPFFIAAEFRVSTQ
jgi:hypothetical protein